MEGATIYCSWSSSWLSLDIRRQIASPLSYSAFHNFGFGSHHRWQGDVPNSMESPDSISRLNDNLRLCAFIPRINNPEFARAWMIVWWRTYIDSVCEDRVQSWSREQCCVCVEGFLQSWSASLACKWRLIAASPEIISQPPINTFLKSEDPHRFQENKVFSNFRELVYLLIL